VNPRRVGSLERGKPTSCGSNTLERGPKVDSSPGGGTSRGEAAVKAAAISPRGKTLEGRKAQESHALMPV
jgi:hypothetical protein